MGYGEDKDVDRTFIRQVAAARRAKASIRGIRAEEEEQKERYGLNPVD